MVGLWWMHGVIALLTAREALVSGGHSDQMEVAAHGGVPDGCGTHRHGTCTWTWVAS